MRIFRTVLVVFVFAFAVGLTAHKFWPKRSALSSRHEIQVATISSSAGSAVSSTPSNPPQSQPNVLSNRVAIAEFQSWAEQFASASVAQRLALATHGIELASQRRAELSALIESDPQAALEQAVPMRVRQQLPPEILTQLEERVGGVGDYDVLAVLAQPGAETTTPAYRRFVRIHDQVYRAYTYGRRLGEAARRQIPLHGIALDGKLALHESPMRVLEPGEVPDPRLRVANSDEICSVSGLPSGRAVVVQVGEEIHYLCSGGHIEAFAGKFADAENSPQSLSPWTSGIKTLLFMRLNFTDDLAESISATDATNLMLNVSNWFFEGSYSNTAIQATITPLLTMPQAKSYYAQQGTGYGDFTLMSDALQVARTNGYTNTTYDLYCIHYKPIFAFGGQAYVGAAGAWLQSGTGVGVPCHEFGHNYGLWHANSWTAPGDTVIGPGTNLEYGNLFDTMGSANAGDWQYTTYEKNLLGWLADSSLATVTNSGTFRVYAYDGPLVNNGGAYALKIVKDSTRNYWVELRQRFTSNEWIQNGVMINWSAWQQSNGGGQLLDTTPGSADGRNDAAVVVGRTFTDPIAGIHITPIQKYNTTTPPSMDVVVNLGLFPGNHKPVVSLTPSATTAAINAPLTFTVTASDPDGDSLAYYWEFGDSALGTNEPVAVKSWSAAGDYVVRCVVSDMKGGTTSAKVLVTIGSPTTFRIAGNVSGSGGPLDGVRVAASTENAYTDANGNYILTGLPAGSYTVTAIKSGLNFSTSGFSNPVVVGPHASGINFTSTQQTYSLSGKVTDKSVGIPGVPVFIGTNAVVTDASGNFVFAGLPPGGYQVTPVKAGYEFLCASGWTNPAAIDWANATNKSFNRPLYSITGQITGLTATAAVSIGDPLHVTTSFNQGGGQRYTLQVPGGQWNLQATLAGYTIAPVNFVNPVSVTSNVFLGPGFNFNAVAGSTYSISGNVSDSAAPLLGVAIQTAGFAGVSDTVGNYLLTGLSNGNYSVTAALAGYHFTPPALSALISGASLVNQNFVGQLDSLRFTNVAFWRLGENDPGSAAGVTATNTVDTTGTRKLIFQGNARYSGDVSTSAANALGSAFSINFTNGAFATNTIVSSATDNFGIECWVKPTALGIGGQVIAYNGGTGGFGDGGWGLLVAADNTYQALYGGVTLFGTNAVVTNVWTHLALVRDSGIATLYVNGTPTVTSMAVPANPLGNFALGAPPQSPTSQFFSGLLDEVRVFTFAAGQFSTNDLLFFSGPSARSGFTSWGRRSDGAFQVQFVVQNGTNYTIEASPDLSHWIDLLDFTSGSNSPVLFTDPAATNYPQRFYRFSQH
jgi:Concanavalin A-like lectin/glucanases superfamily/PKD domain/Carboxypeptidase regulatory-like domain